MLKLVVILTPTEPFITFRESVAFLAKQYPKQFQVELFSTKEIDDNQDVFEKCVKESSDADLILINIFGSLVFFKKFLKYYKQFQGQKRFYINTTVEEEAAELFPECRIMKEDYNMIYQYYRSGGKDNITNLLLWIGNQFANLNVPYAPPVYPRWCGIYDPEMKGTEEEYLSCIKNSDLPVIGIIINQALVQEKNLEHINHLIRNVKRQNAIPLCVYAELLPSEELNYGGIQEVLEHYMMSDGKPIVGSIINTVGHSVSIITAMGNGSKPQEHSIFERFGVAVFQVMSTMQSYDEWIHSVKGLDSLSLSWSVFQPEFDGQVITYPFAAIEWKETDFGKKKYYIPIEDRIDAIVKIAINWAKLRKTENQNKKVAIILHNNPPRNDNIGGAAGLDTPVSVHRMISEMEKKGIQTEYQFKDGKDIIDRITSGLTNDGRWSSPERMLEKSIDTVDQKEYQQWCQNLIPRIKENMKKYWGDPVGDFMAVNDQLLIPGIMNGNIFIGLQPPRAFEEKAEEMYHSTDIPCPHQYIAFYRWVENIFKADIIIHVGTHGTIEWLPGKEVGLSKDCYSDICIGTVPHLYIYIINAPGEGTQAKRRTYATLIDHMVPSMVESGVYENLAQMDELMRQYYHIKAVDSKKLPLIQKEIRDFAIQMNLNQDIGLTEEMFDADIDDCIQKMHSWVTNIQTCDIADGFHILGEVPAGDRYRNMLKMLVRNRNGNIPSLRDGICELMGLNYDELLAAPETPTLDGRSYGMLLVEVDDLGRRIFYDLEETGFHESAIESIIEKYHTNTGNSVTKLKTCLIYVCDFIKPRVLQASNEIGQLIRGIEGEFTPPGPSGAPTRGNAAILPTGRNFYSVDPGAMPSRSSWEVGNTLTNQLIEKYVSEDGYYPETVTILVWATEAMRNYGDDISETFCLLGVRPVWLGNTYRVIDIEAIPLKELGRPRIDVTLRITGLFRDAFPNLIERVEDAVNLVAALDEPEDINYIKKHVREDMEEMIAQGIDLEVAAQQARYRVFGDPPGAYGAGVNNVVESKKWKDVTDLGTVYTTWGCHAYGKKVHGDKLPQLFALRMKKTSVAVKNQSTREVDMLDSDDFYNYFGGLVAAITTHSEGRKPAYVPCTSDADHVETMSLHKEASRVMRVRVNNPKWIEGLKKHGYRGAKQVSSMVDFAFGWDATTNVIDDWMYDCIAERYAFNKENSDWMREVNPWALHNIAERLLEAYQRGMWNASEDKVQNLKSIYMEMEGNLEELG